MHSWQIGLEYYVRMLSLLSKLRLDRERDVEELRKVFVRNL